MSAAYLDDLTKWAVDDLLRVHLCHKCRISPHAGKTKVWNKSDIYPPDCARLQRATMDVSLEAVVWRGTPICTLINRDSRCLDIQRTSSGLLRTTVCCSIGFRAVNLSETDEFAASHDRGVWRCLFKILSILPSCGAEDQARWFRIPERPTQL